LRFTLFLSALCCLPLLAACGPEVSGSPEPPKEFGAVQGKLLGCPSMAGLYAWPPVEGEYAKFFPTNRTPWDGGRPVPVYPRKMQIKVEETGSRVTVRARVIGEASMKSSEARDWGYVEYGVAQYSCKSGMLVFEELPVGNAANYGGTDAKRGFTLAKMKDGSLAVGIKTTAMGRSGSFFSWGGQSYGSYGAPDKVFWSWSRLGALDPAKN
jgi:hypothetical protein